MRCVVFFTLLTPLPAIAAEIHQQKLLAADPRPDMAFGRAISAGQDFDGDGLDDLAVGQDIREGDGAGGVRVYRGTPVGLSRHHEELVVPVDTYPGQGFGHALTGGDLDGDGFGDLVASTAPEDGRVYVISGSSRGLDPERQRTIELPPGFQVDRMRRVGDLDADGYDDVALGDWVSDTVLVVFGGPPDQERLREQWLRGESGERFGVDLSGAGDVDADGFDDLLVAASYGDGREEDTGTVHVFHGTAAGLEPRPRTVLFASDGASLDMFRAVAGGGDIDADGYDDVVVGAYRAHHRGAVYVYRGGPSGVRPATEAIVRARDSRAMDWFGDTVAAVGDTDGDGYDDVAVGNQVADQDGTDSGAVYVYRGGPQGLHGELRLSRYAPAEGDRFGAGLCAGDIDGDGATDLLAAAPGDLEGASRIGAVYRFWTPQPPACEVDADGDHACASVDCDDQDPEVYPGAPEWIGDEVDSDCDGRELCYVDRDGDGVRGAEGFLQSEDADCADPGEASASVGPVDCDDDDHQVHPGAEDLAGDGIDQDCDGRDARVESSGSDGARRSRTVITDPAGATDSSPARRGRPAASRACSTAGAASAVPSAWIALAIVCGWRRRRRSRTTGTR